MQTVNIKDNLCYVAFLSFTIRVTGENSEWFNKTEEISGQYKYTPYSHFLKVDAYNAYKSTKRDPFPQSERSCGANIMSNQWCDPFNVCT